MSCPLPRAWLSCPVGGGLEPAQAGSMVAVVKLLQGRGVGVTGQPRSWGRREKQPQGSHSVTTSPTRAGSRGEARTPQPRLRWPPCRTGLPRSGPAAPRLPQPQLPAPSPGVDTGAPHSEAPGRERAWGRVALWKSWAQRLGPGARSSMEAGAEAAHSPRKVWSCPRRVPSGAPRARSLGAACQPALVYFRGYTVRPRRSSEAERPREGVPATPSAPLPPTGASWAQPAHRPPGPVPSKRRAGLGILARAPRKEGELQNRAPRTPSLFSRRSPGSAARL